MGEAPTRPGADGGAAPHSRSRPPDEMSRLRRIRRYAVPGWMIERATERRLAGDWRGACAAANVDVAFDPADLARGHGAAVAAAIEDDLRHLAPDLLRWHVPRVGRGRTTITPAQVLVLSGGAPRDPAAPRLHVTTPPLLVHGPQRLTLRFGPIPDDWFSLETDVRFCSFWRGVVHDWTASRHLWDARRTDELRERGGGGDRAPFFAPDGAPRPEAELPTADPGPADPAARTEWVTALHERGEVEAAFAAAGVELDAPGFDLDPYYTADRVEPLDILERLPLNLTRLEPEMRRLAPGARRWIPCTQHAIILLEHDGTSLRLRVVGYEDSGAKGTEVLPEASWRRPPDLDLLRDGRTPPEHLHPLVRAALFPTRPPAAGSSEPREAGLSGRPSAVGSSEPPGVELSGRPPGADSSPTPEAGLSGHPPELPGVGPSGRSSAAGSLGSVGVESFGRSAGGGPFASSGAEAPAVVRVRCQGEWHEVGFRDGVFRLAHEAEEERRERAIRALGGPLAGCFAVREAWTSGVGRLPRALLERRRELFARLQHGDTPAVLRLLDAGLDPAVRDGRRRTLLHTLHLVDHEPLLPRLLAAGLDVEARDQDERTPLHVAVFEDGSPALVRALLDAGARIDVLDEEETSILRLITLRDREDLAFLSERIEREHPGLAEEW